MSKTSFTKVKEVFFHIRLSPIEISAVSLSGDPCVHTGLKSILKERENVHAFSEKNPP
jgi:hypothetical protein